MARKNTGKNVQFQRAVEYILAHPDETKLQQAANAGVHEITIARARRELIKEGRLPSSRKNTSAPNAQSAPPKPVSSVEKPPALSKPPDMLDHEAMLALAALSSELDHLTNEQVEERLVKQCLIFAFNSKLHPDTRMSATNMWSKYRDRAKEKDLGPGAPLTREDAVTRLREILIACGPDITLEAVNSAFTVIQEPSNEGSVPANEAEAPRDPPVAAETPGSQAGVPADEKPAGPF